MTSSSRSNFPLVSILVITYNSAKFVIETLESAKAQTYQNIELIISDDCSTDDTVELCRLWISKNKNQFKRTEIITAKKNTGIPSNCNRGVNAAHGEWIKLIAGDDTLLINCINHFISFINTNQNTSIVFSILNQYKNTFDKENFLRRIPGKSQQFFFNNKITPQEQYRLLLVRDRIGFSATVFIRKEAIVTVGYFDEQYKYIEDYPMWLKLTKQGYKLYFMPKTTVNYRQHAQSVYNNLNSYLVHPSFFNSEILRKDLVYPYINLGGRLYHLHNYVISLVLVAIFQNKNNLFTRQIRKFLLKYCNPFFWISR